MTVTTPDQAYKTELHNALEEFQFIEELLRVCIAKSIEIARLQLEPFIPIKFTKKDIEIRSLGGLVRIFSKINGDTQLHQELNAITSERNHVAHRSLLLTLGEWEDPTGMAEATVKMTDLAARAQAIRYKLLDIRVDLHKSLHSVQHSKSCEDQQRTDTAK